MVDYYVVVSLTGDQGGIVMVDINLQEYENRKRFVRAV